MAAVAKTRTTHAGAAKATEEQAERDAARLLKAVDVRPERAEVLLASGRRYAVETQLGGDRLTVQAPNGQVMLHVLLTDAGPVLSFAAAQIELRATELLALRADRIEIATGAMKTSVTGPVEEHVAGDRKTRVDGTERLEAAAIETQANHGAVEVRAAGRIALDGEHIGLNDDPCPKPFGWSAIAKEETKR